MGGAPPPTCAACSPSGKPNENARPAGAGVFIPEESGFFENCIPPGGLRGKKGGRIL